MSVVSPRRVESSADRPTAASRPTPPVLTHGLVATGVALVGAGAVLPWLTVYNGLTDIPGFRLGGGPLVGAALAAAGLVLVAVHLGRGRILRPVAGAAAAVVAVWSLVIARGVLGYVADPGPTGQLLLPRAGLGAYVLAAGALAILAAAVVARPAPRRRAGFSWPQLTLAALTFVVGWVHLLLAPEHLEEHPFLGTGFIVVGLSQVVLAAFVMARRTSFTTLPLLVVLDVAVMAVYAYAVFVGLPFTGDAGGMEGMDMHETHGLVLGAGEPVDLVGAATFVMEASGVGLVVVLLRQLARRSPAAA